MCYTIIVPRGRGPEPRNYRGGKRSHPHEYQIMFCGDIQGVWCYADRGTFPRWKRHTNHQRRSLQGYDYEKLARQGFFKAAFFLTKRGKNSPLCGGGAVSKVSPRFIKWQQKPRPAPKTRHLTLITSSSFFSFLFLFFLGKSAGFLSPPICSTCSQQ